MSDRKDLIPSKPPIGLSDSLALFGTMKVGTGGFPITATGMLRDEPSPDYVRMPLGTNIYSAQTEQVMQRIKGLQNKTRILSQPKRGEAPSETTVTERLFDARAEAKIVASQYAIYFDRKLRDYIFDQLDALHDPEEWQLEDHPINVASFRTFLRAIYLIRGGRRPGLGLTYSGNLIAAWVAGRDRLTIEFQPNDHVRWVLTYYSDEEPERAAAQVKISRLLESLSPYNAEHWFNSGAKA